MIIISDVVIGTDTVLVSFADLSVVVDEESDTAVPLGLLSFVLLL